MKRYGTRASVCPIRSLQQRAVSFLLLWAQRIRDINRLLQQRRAADECGQCHVPSVRR